ncbi:MAG: hypothetical protein MZV64_59380 [Ignavibacteriales bacterium]|nr:hypothetical protein [Ignavibacteriales bacterium]
MVEPSGLRSAAQVLQHHGRREGNASRLAAGLWEQMKSFVDKAMEVEHEDGQINRRISRSTKSGTQGQRRRHGPGCARRCGGTSQAALVALKEKQPETPEEETLGQVIEQYGLAR